MMKTMLIKWNYSYEARKIPVFNILLDLTTAQHVCSQFANINKGLSVMELLT